jgi:hypothetical protein
MRDKKIPFMNEKSSKNGLLYSFWESFSANIIARATLRIKGRIEKTIYWKTARESEFLCGRFRTRLASIVTIVNNTNGTKRIVTPVRGPVESLWIMLKFGFSCGGRGEDLEFGVLCCNNNNWDA